MIERLKKLCRLKLEESINEAELCYKLNVDIKSESYNHFILIHARFAELERDLGLNLVSRSHFDLTRSQTINSYLSFFGNIDYSNTVLIESEKYFEILNNNQTIRTVPLLTYDELVIGRSSDSDIELPDHGLSRKHCKILVKENKYYIKDMESKNGIFLNGVKIEEAPISTGDIIEIASYKLVLKDPLDTN